jgi:hypothetical protein
MLLSRQLVISPLTIVRLGDVFSRMIEHSARCKDWGTTSALIQELQKRLPQDNLTYYVSQGRIESFSSSSSSFFLRSYRLEIEERRKTG